MYTFNSFFIMLKGGYELACSFYVSRTRSSEGEDHYMYMSLMEEVMFKVTVCACVIKICQRT